MNSSKRVKGLGRGLEALLGPTVSVGAVVKETQQKTGEIPRELALTDLVAGMYQPRRHMDEGALYELAESIKSQGIMQPLLVRKLALPKAGAGYEIIAGERRFRAAKIAGLEKVPVLVRDVGDEAAAVMALIENMQREDLNPLEEAQGLQRLIDEFSFTHEQAAQAVGRSRSAASNLLRLLQLTPVVQSMLTAGDLDMGHARALLALDSAQQVTCAHEISAKKLSVRQAEGLVKKVMAPSKASAAASQRPTKSRDIARIEEALSDALTAQVEIRLQKAKSGKAAKGAEQAQAGEIAIAFSSMEELNGLLAVLERNAKQAY